jgi:catechol 2,3-dioxygenase-like lactoylglutathione lyase family enzyme
LFPRGSAEPFERFESLSGKEMQMINAFQHVGMGVWDVDKTYSFYKKLFGYKIKLNDITMASKEMEPVVGSLETMRIVMAMNARGGGILEFVEHKSSPVRPYPEEAGYGNCGVLEIGFGVRAIEKVVDSFRTKGVTFLTPVCEFSLADGRRRRYAYLTDPDGMKVQLVEDLRPGQPAAEKPEVHGVFQVGIGVSDVEASKAFYGNAVGFDREIYSFDGHNPDLDPVSGGPIHMNTVILERSAPNRGPVRELPSGTIKLMAVSDEKGEHIYKGRRWGDIGCMEFCMDVSDLEGAVEDAKRKGIPIYLQPCEVDMGSGSKGKVAYIRDPDGTIVEFVEICSIAWLSASNFMRIAMPALKVYDRLAPP